MSWALTTREEIRRKIGIVAVTFIGVFVVGIAFFSLVGDRDAPFTVAVGLLDALGFAAFAASGACMIATLPFNYRLRDAADRDVGTKRKVGKVVLSNKEFGLDRGEQVAAAKYAAVIPTTLGYMVSNLNLLYIWASSK